MKGKSPKNVDEQKELGVYVYSSLKVETEINRAAKKHMACLPSELKAWNIKVGMLHCNFTEHWLDCT